MVINNISKGICESQVERFSIDQKLLLIKKVNHKVY